MVNVAVIRPSFCHNQIQTLSFNSTRLVVFQIFSHFWNRLKKRHNKIVSDFYTILPDKYRSRRWISLIQIYLKYQKKGLISTQ